MSAAAARGVTMRKWALLGLSLLALLAGCSARKQDLLQAEKLQREGKTEAALASYLKLFTQVPEKQKAAGSLIELRIAECLWKLGRNREAYATLQRAVEEYPANTAAHLRLAELLLQRLRASGLSIAQVAGSSPRRVRPPADGEQGLPRSARGSSSSPPWTP